jgi:hypothetical protein
MNYVAWTQVSQCEDFNVYVESCNVFSVLTSVVLT